MKFLVTITEAKKVNGTNYSSKIEDFTFTNRTSALEFASSKKTEVNQTLFVNNQKTGKCIYSSLFKKK